MVYFHDCVVCLAGTWIICFDFQGLVLVVAVVSSRKYGGRVKVVVEVVRCDLYYSRMICRSEAMGFVQELGLLDCWRFLVPSSVPHRLGYPTGESSKSWQSLLPRRYEDVWEKLHDAGCLIDWKPSG